MLIDLEKLPQDTMMSFRIGDIVSQNKRIAELEAALERVAAQNDLSGGFEDQCSAAHGRLAECEAIARAALERK